MRVRSLVGGSDGVIECERERAARAVAVFVNELFPVKSVPKSSGCRFTTTQGLVAPEGDSRGPSEVRVLTGVDGI